MKMTIFTYETRGFYDALQHEKSGGMAGTQDDMHMRDVTYHFAYICTNIYAAAVQQCDARF